MVSVTRLSECVIVMDLYGWKFRFSSYGEITIIDKLMRHSVVSWECKIYMNGKERLS